MQLRLEQLGRHLEGTMRPLYFVGGEEYLLNNDACDAIVEAASKYGYVERVRHDVTSAAAWSDIFSQSANFSLFSEKKIIDIRLPGKGLDRSGSDAVRKYIEAPIDGNIVLIRGGSIDWRQRNSAWYKAIDEMGVAVMTWPVRANELPKWIRDRARLMGLTLSQRASEVLASRVEGNLLAGQQELEKLRLLLVEGDEISEKDILLSDTSHYETFDLIDTALAGNFRRVRKMVLNLRREGVAVFMIIGALTAQLRRLYHYSLGRKQNVSRNRNAAIQAFLQRSSSEEIEELMRECGRLDQQAKGMLRGDPWVSLDRILLRVAGIRSSSLDGEAPYLSLV